MTVLEALQDIQTKHDVEQFDQNKSLSDSGLTHFYKELCVREEKDSSRR